MQDYATHLRSIGVDPGTLELDSNGTLATRPPPVPAGADLPRVTVTTSNDPSADLQVLRTIGTGGMGEVMLAVQRALGREVAIKRLHPHLGLVAAAELLREALVTGRLEHPNIVPVHMLAVTPDGTPFFVMKRIEGIPWRKLLKDRAALERVTREKAEPLVLHLDIFLAVCDAVSFAHSRGVLHRDLKPENVMVGSFGEVYVLDWGIAVGLTAESGLPLARDVASVTGTPAYMSPEMAAADGKSLGPATDVFLLGAILHELLLGRPPHVAPDPLGTLDHAWKWDGPPKNDPAVPEGLGEVLQRAMARKPQDRFESVDALRAAVAQYLRHRDAVALSAEAKARAATLDALLLAQGKSDEVQVNQAFFEARFGFAQAARIWPGFESAKRGIDAVTTAMARYELKVDRPAAARALLAQLSTPDPALAAEITQAETRIAERSARLDALERDVDLDRAVSTRGVFAIIQGVVCGAFILLMGVLVRAGIAPFAHREALIGIAVFGFVQLVFVDRALRPKLNQAGLRTLNANAVSLAGFVAFWGGAWAMNVPFHTAVVLFMVFIAVGWGLVAALFDARASAVAITYALGAVATLAWPAAMFEIFGAATITAFALLGRAWRRSGRP